MLFKNIETKRRYQREWVAKRRALYFANKKCSECGCAEDLCLHHAKPENKISHTIWTWTASRRHAEIEKCIVLCQSCHRELHVSKKKTPLVHGTIAAYKGRHACRCNVCRKAVAVHQREYRKQKGE